MRVFLDAYILFSACIMGSGISRLLELIVLYCEALTCQYAYEEARRNLQKKLPKAERHLDEWMQDIKIVQDSLLIPSGIALTSKDKMILGSALAARSAYLVTGDRKDFGILFNQDIQGLQIVTPQSFSLILAQHYGKKS